MGRAVLYRAAWRRATLDRLLGLARRMKPQPKSLNQPKICAAEDFSDLPHAIAVLLMGQRNERRAAARWIKKRGFCVNERASRQLR